MYPENKKITLSLIPKRKNSVIQDDSEATQLTGTSISIGCPIGRSGALVNPLTREEQKALEELLGIDLNPYKTKDNFYNNDRRARLIFKKTHTNISSADVVLDLNDALDYIRYKIAKISPLVANTWGERHEPQYKVVIKDEADIIAEKVSKVEKESTVFEYIITNKTHRKKLFNLATMFGRGKLTSIIDKDTPLEQIYTTLFNTAKTNSGLTGLYNIIQLSDEEVENRLKVLLGVDLGVIIQKGDNFYTQGGTVLGYSLKEAAATLTKAEYNNINLRITTSIKSDTSKVTTKKNTKTIKNT